MPIEVRAGADGDYVTLRIIDPYTLDEWQRSLLDAVRHAAYRKGYRILVDRRRASPIESQMVDAMVGFFREHHDELGSSRVAIVVSDDVAFGMARMTSLKSAMDLPDAEIRPFRDYDAAVGWMMNGDGSD